MSDRGLKERLLREKQWRRAKRDVHYAIAQGWHIKVPGQGKVLMQAREPQTEAFDHWQSHRYSLTLKARQIGWSTATAAFCWWECFFYPDREIMFISRGEREAQELLAKVAYGFNNLPDWMKQRGPARTNDSKLRIDFSNGSSIISLPSANDPARGFSGFRVVVDEWAFLPNADDAWASIEPVADVGGRITGLSTANGYGNFFHSLWVGATTGTNQFSPMFHSWKAGGRNQEWYDKKKNDLPEWQMSQEYPDNPDEAFLKSGNPVFDLEAVRRQEPNCRRGWIGDMRAGVQGVFSGIL